MAGLDSCYAAPGMKGNQSKKGSDALPSDPRIEIKASETGYEGFFRIERYRLRHRRHDGHWSELMWREVFHRDPAAAVLPYDPERDEVVLIEQFRLPAFLAGRRPWQLEVVAGILGEGETPEDVVRREALEEAGCMIEELEPILTYLPSGGGSSETITLFCGRCDASAIGGVHGLDSEHEDIRAFTIPAEKAFESLENGEAQNSPLAIALLWLRLERPRLRERWRR